MIPEKPNAKDLAVLMGQQPLSLVPALLEASRGVKQAETAISERQRNELEERAHKKTMEVFSRIDIKQNELEIYEKAMKDVVVENEVIGKNGNTDIVRRKIVKSRNINHLVRSLGRQEVAEIIRLLLINVNNYFNVKDGLNLYQIVEIAEQIIDECGDKLFIDELVYIFKKAKSHSTKDNSVYNHIDGSIIFGWIDQHIRNKFHERERNHANNKGENFDLPNLPKGLLKEAVEKMSDGYRKNIISMTTVPKIEKAKKKKKED
jgi:hypothetical protein